MRYSYEYKVKCVELYRRGLYPETPEGVSTKSFRGKIQDWAAIEEACGPEALRHKLHNKSWTADERYELVAQVLAGKPCREVAFPKGITPTRLSHWVQKYKTMGYNGLVGRGDSQPLKGSQMKHININRPAPLNESEREELIRLRAEVAYIKAENEVIKKEIALREQRQAALLKAKKQQSSKNCTKKDMN